MSVEYEKIFQRSNEPPMYSFLPIRITPYYLRVAKYQALVFASVNNSTYTVPHAENVNVTDKEWEEFKTMVDWVLKEMQQVDSTVLV